MMVLAGGGSEPDQMARGRDRVRDLYDTMHKTRIRELMQVGFDRPTAKKISELHGSAVRNFM